MNDKKFARENKRIIKGMGIGMLVGPLFFLISFFFKTSGHIQSFQVIVSIAIGVTLGLTLGGLISANLAVNKIVESNIPWQKKLLKLTPKVIGMGLLVAAIGVLIDWTTNGMSISITQIILSGSTWEWFLDGAILELLFIR